MRITATELKRNLGYYLSLVATENIWISKNGKTIAKLVAPNISSVDSISGILNGKVAEETDREFIRDERLNGKES